MKEVWPDKAGCLCARMSRGFNGQDAMGLTVVTKITLGGGISATLDASYYKGPGSRNGKEREFLTIETGESKQKRKYIVRRLTPTECARLQGFPDWWTDGVEGSDSAKYKMWGNGIALPCAIDVLGRIANELMEACRG